MPRTVRLVNHEHSLLLKDARDMTVVIRTPLRFETDRAPFALHFEPLASRYVARRNWLPYATVDEWLQYVADHRAPGDPRVIE